MSALSRADSFLMEQEAIAESHRGRGAKRNKTKKKKTRPYGREIAVYQALQNLCGGFYKVNITVVNTLAFLYYLIDCCILLTFKLPVMHAHCFVVEFFYHDNFELTGCQYITSTDHT